MLSQEIVQFQLTKMNELMILFRLGLFTLDLILIHSLMISRTFGKSC